MSSGAGLPDDDLVFVLAFFALGSSGSGLSDPELETEGLLFGGIFDDNDLTCGR